MIDATLLNELRQCDIPLIEQPAEFLSVVWSAMPANSVIGLSVDKQYTDRATGEIKHTTEADWCYADDEYDFQAWAHSRNTDRRLIETGHGSIFWNIAGRKPSILGYDHPRYRRGSYDELTALCVFAIDLDVSDVGGDYRGVVNGIQSIPLKPTAVLYSGGGLQVIWVLTEAWNVDTRATAQQYKEYAVQFAKVCAQYLPIDPDFQTQEPARMLRVPGFVNRKLKRNGAIAELLQWNPERRYSIAEMKAFIGELPQSARQETTIDYTPSDGVYIVGDDFVNYLINDQPCDSGKRHDTLLHLACEGAAAQIPPDVLTPRLRRLALDWYADNPNESGPHDELDKIIDWAYQHAGAAGYQRGLWPVEATNKGFRRVIDTVASEKIQRSRIHERVPTPDESAFYELVDLRIAQDDKIVEWLAENHTNIAKIYLLATSPGTGKTRALLHALVHEVERLISLGADIDVDKGLALFLTQFKVEDLEEWLRSLDLDPHKHKRLFGEFKARENDDKSRGFCANFDRAQEVGQKGHNIVKTLCSVCPAQQMCRDRYYLSQFERLKHYWIVIARWQHGLMEELASYRKIIVFDENPMDVVSRPIIVEPQEMTLGAVVPHIEDQYKAEVEAIDQLLATLRLIITGNRELRLGGAWLMSQLITQFGEKRLNYVLHLPKQVVKGVNVFDVGDLSNVVNSIPHYVEPLIDVLRYEFDNCRESDSWNSRLIPDKNVLNIVPMEPFSFTKNTTVISADALPLPIYYPVMFADRHREKVTLDNGKIDYVKAYRPRRLVIFEGQLRPRAKITVYTGSENTKRGLFHASKATNELSLDDRTFEYELECSGVYNKRDYTLQDTILLAERIRPHNSALAHLMLVTHELVEKLNKDGKPNLLVVIYKGLLGSEEQPSLFKRWLDRSNIIPSENVQWFHSLRGKNDWKDCDAVLLVGTPRIREDDLLKLAQALHWRDTKTIEAERCWQREPYPGKDDTGKAWEYEFWGYRDPRVNRLYVHLIASEMRQCYERIRANLTDGKEVYVATNFPCTDHVNIYDRWERAQVELVTHQVFLDCYRKSEVDPEHFKWKDSDMIREIQERANCSRSTAVAAVDREYRQGKVEIKHVSRCWDNVLDREYFPHGAKGFSVTGQPKPETRSARSLLFDWMWMSGIATRYTLSNKAVIDGFKRDFPNEQTPSTKTVERARADVIKRLNGMSVAKPAV